VALDPATRVRYPRCMSASSPPSDRSNPGEDPGPPPWPEHGRREGLDLGIFKLRHDLLENPRTGALLERLVLQAPDWVNVIALTPEGRAVCVRQYRFGSRQVTLEVPGGMVDPGEGHQAAARRELLEETVYEAERWTYLGAVDPNPAVHDNQLHSWLAEGARPVARPTPDPGEDLRVVEVPLDELVEEARAGKLRHALVLCALLRVADLSRSAPDRGRGAPPR
jgi:ADP-ribose pyrophosphatase